MKEVLKSVQKCYVHCSSLKSNNVRKYTQHTIYTQTKELASGSQETTCMH